LTEQANELKKKGVQGTELFETLAAIEVKSKRHLSANRCERCWHDLQRRCICSFLNRGNPTLPVKVLILMHHKEYLSAGDDAKLLPMILPPENSELFVFGLAEDWKRFGEELAVDPAHTLTLWPGDDALTVESWTASLAEDSPWRVTAHSPNPPPKSARPFLRVVVLDACYGQARQMFRAMRTRLPPDRNPPYVALRPSTLSVYHRAQKNYAAATAHREVLRICTVEAYALLLQELGECRSLCEALVGAVVTNNAALGHDPAVRPDSGMSVSSSSGAARRRRTREKCAQIAATP